MVYIFLIYSINVYIYTVSSVSKGVKNNAECMCSPLVRLFQICLASVD